MNELVSSAQFYEGRRPGLGADFLAAVGHAIARMQASPEQFAIVERDLRRCLLSRFPYAILFRNTETALRILAVRHHSQHPDIGQDRQ